jgi:hypothetical protein
MAASDSDQEKPTGKSGKKSAKSSAGKEKKPAKAAEQATDQASQAAPNQAEAAESMPAEHLEQHHISKILDEVLDEPEEPVTEGRLKHPMWLDGVLAAALLVTVGGFTLGLFKIYITHNAEQSITQHNYKAAIALLKGAPFPGFFTIPGADPAELLNQALYLDAMDKLEVDNNVDAALNELQQIRPGSRFFGLAQEIINENFEPSSTTLQGGAEITEKAPAHPIEEKKPLLPELKDASP